MSLKIRLARGGAKKRPFYRVVVADTRSPRDGKFIERLGSYNPMVAKDNPERVVINAERAKHWLSVGAVPSDRVARILSGLDLVPKPTWREQTKKSQPRPKTVERMKAEEEAQVAKAKAAADEAEAAKAAAAAAAAAPPEEVVEAPAEEVAEAPAEEVAAAPAEEVVEAPAEAAPAEEAPAAEAPAAEAPAEDVKKD